MHSTGVDQSPALTLRVRRGTGRPVIVLVSTKVFSRAVDRNRVRRQVTEAVRRIGARPTLGYQCVVSVRHTKVPEGRDMDRVLFELLKQSGIVVR